MYESGGGLDREEVGSLSWESGLRKNVYRDV